LVVDRARDFTRLRKAIEAGCRVDADHFADPSIPLPEVLT
jgi:hypothetical protein